LGHLTSPDVRAAFEGAIDAREAAGHVLDNRLVEIDRATIDAARLNGKEAEVDVRFHAYVAVVTRDAEGNMVAGSLTDAVESHDIWTFRRDLKSRDPNWLLVETDDLGAEAHS
jgi:predicted lipid-binding transport protein (Tim44 family)